MISANKDNSFDSRFSSAKNIRLFNPSIDLICFIKKIIFYFVVLRENYCQLVAHRKMVNRGEKVIGNIDVLQVFEKLNI